MSASDNDTNSAMARARRRGRSIAISGANTFLGRNLVGLLGEDERVSRIVVVDVENPSTSGPKTSFYDVDLTQPGVDSRLAEILHAEAVDTFVHLAFLESPTQATAFAHELESVGTMRVLLACHKQNIQKLVVGSSVLVYGAHADNPNFLTEDRKLSGMHGAHFIADKIDVEQQVAKYAAEHADASVTVLRMASILGPTVGNFVTKWLSRSLVPTVLGFDPLVQFTHEIDAVAALKLAVDRNVSGVFNIASEGVLPISTVIKLAGRLAVPVPYGLMRRFGALLWVAQVSDAPPPFAALMRFLCVVDCTRARSVLGFRPAYSSRDAVLDFEGALRSRSTKLLGEATR
jgi:UDP-glucose 4-epimerase